MKYYYYNVLYSLSTCTVLVDSYEERNKEEEKEIKF